MRLRASLLITIGAFFLATGCGDDEPEPSDNQAKECSPVAQTGCAAGQVCEEVDGSAPACFAPVTVQGLVFDALTKKPVVGARVVARDANDAAVSSVAVTGADGTYKLRVPAKRGEDRKPLSVKYTLRADASAYDIFPKAPRIAIPVDIAEAAGEPLVLKSAATDIALIPIPDATGLGFISGKVGGALPGGTLVVAGGSTGIADVGGDYVVYNVTPGSVEVRAYAAGRNYDPATASVTAGKETSSVNITANDKPTATISGKLGIVNGGGASVTSVVLAVEETFIEAAARGEVPKGLRVGNVSGDWSIPLVPDGKYVVLAAFENDGLVRDPDTSIGGTEIVHITVDGKDQPLSQSFKVTGALAVQSPGAEAIEEVSGAPEFIWEDDSSEDTYTLRLFDALGNEVWMQEGVVDAGGGKPVSVMYPGDAPALKPGMIYQFRATSIKDGVPISQTEDLKGVFQYK